MKKLLTVTVCSIPLAFGSLAYGQTAPDTTAPATTPDGTGAPGTPPASGAPGAPAPGTGATGTPGADTPTTGATGMASDSERKESVRGWSVKDKIIGKSVYNENDEKVGDISDVVLTSDGEATYFVVGAGGFLGMGTHDVAIPYDEIQRNDDRFILSGYTKDQLKALPKVELAE